MVKPGLLQYGCSHMYQYSFLSEGGMPQAEYSMEGAERHSTVMRREVWTEIQAVSGSKRSTDYQPRVFLCVKTSCYKGRLFSFPDEWKRPRSNHV